MSPQNKNKIILIITAVIIIAIAAGLMVWRSKKIALKEQTPGKTGEAAPTITENAVQGVLPSLQTNPLENKPNINPVDQTNPFKNLKTNPFE